MNIFTSIRRKYLLASLLFPAGIAAQAQTPFTCQNNVSYVTRNAASSATSLPYTLYQNNLGTGSQTAIGNVTVNGVNVPVNAIGYNTADNFIYASESGTTNILKIASDGTATRIPVTGLTGTTSALTFQAGEVAGGYLYLYRGEGTGSRVIYKVNVSTNPATAETFTLPSGQGVELDDFSVGADGKIYALSDAGNLIVFTLTGGGTTGTATRTSTDVSIPTAQGFNTFMGSDGLLYAQSTSNSGTATGGYTYVVDPSATPAATMLKMVLQGGVVNQQNSDGTSCQTTTPYNAQGSGFGCQPGIAYLWDQSSNWLVEVNTNGTPVSTTLKDYGSSLPGSFNNLGFNPKDGCLYLHRRSTNQLLRIRGDLSVEYVTIPGLYSGFLNSGEFDANGIFYMMDGNQNTKTVYKVDLDPASPTYKTVLGNFTFNPAVTPDIVDMAVNPIDGMLYGVSVTGITTDYPGGTNGTLYRINPANGQTCALGAVGISSYKVAVFSDPSGNLYFRTSAGTTLYKIKTPVQNIPCGNTSTALSGATGVLSGLAFSGNGDGARCLLAPFVGPTISGSIWNDGNGNHTVDGSENTTTPPTLPAGETLTVYLVNPEGIIVGKADVGSDGNWSMPDVAPGTYTVVLSNDATKNVTQSATGLSTTLPSGWNNTGYQFPGSTGTGASGPLTVGDTDVNNLDFGLNKKPVVADKTAEEKPNPGGSVLSPVTFPSPADSYSGTDLEDGTYPATLTGKTVTLTPGTGGDLYYDYGSGPVKLTGETTIPNFDPSKVSVDPTAESGATNVKFTYAVTDAAGVKSDPKTVTVPFASALPVTLISFTVRSEGNAAQLAWSTATEINNTGFAIQRSVDLRSWSTIGFVNTKDGHSKTRQEYGFTDATPRTGMNYYRLRQIDTDGQSSESPVRSVVIEKGMKGLQAYPNPVKDQLTVNGLIGNERIQILDLTGRIVTDLTNTSNADTQVLNIRSLAEGSYILNIRSEDGTMISKKLIKTK